MMSKTNRSLLNLMLLMSAVTVAQDGTAPATTALQRVIGALKNTKETTASQKTVISQKVSEFANAVKATGAANWQRIAEVYSKQLEKLPANMRLEVIKQIKAHPVLVGLGVATPIATYFYGKTVFNYARTQIEGAYAVAEFLALENPKATKTVAAVTATGVISALGYKHQEALKKGVKTAVNAVKAHPYAAAAATAGVIGLGVVGYKTDLLNTAKDKAYRGASYVRSCMPSAQSLKFWQKKNNSLVAPIAENTTAQQQEQVAPIVTADITTVQEQVVAPIVTADITTAQEQVVAPIAPSLRDVLAEEGLTVEQIGNGEYMHITTELVAVNADGEMCFCNKNANDEFSVATDIQGPIALDNNEVAVVEDNIVLVKNSEGQIVFAVTTK